MPSSVLVVDDDPALLELISRILKEMDVEAVTARNGVDALMHFQTKGPQTFDAAIIDLNMPQINGAKLVQQLRAIKPELLAILITGLPEMANKMNTKELGFSAVLKKPFTIDQFKATFLRTVMDA